MEFTNEFRKKIVEEHIAQNEGVFLPSEFLNAARSPKHPAHGYFEWDDKKASHQWRLKQARDFARIKIIPSKTEEVHDLTDGSVTIKMRPAFVSPVPMRGSGGGYVSTETKEGVESLREESHHMLSQWIMRFGSILTDQEDKLASRLLKMLKKEKEAA